VSLLISSSSPIFSLYFAHYKNHMGVLLLVASFCHFAAVSVAAICISRSRIIILLVRPHCLIMVLLRPLRAILTIHNQILLLINYCCQSTVDAAEVRRVSTTRIARQCSIQCFDMYILRVHTYKVTFIIKYSTSLRERACYMSRAT
jgi:hypothetical protein